jgi:hypothetical protein
VSRRVSLWRAEREGLWRAIAHGAQEGVNSDEQSAHSYEKSGESASSQFAQHTLELADALDGAAVVIASIGGSRVVLNGSSRNLRD